jgi:hypothetical protein
MKKLLSSKSFAMKVREPAESGEEERNDGEGEGRCEEGNRNESESVSEQQGQVGALYLCCQR